MKRLMILLPLLAACGTPQEQCINRETRDLRTVEKLIAETSLNLSRGYAMEEYVTYEREWQECDIQPPPPKKGNPPPPRMCWESEPVTRERPVAIDLRAETQKLDGLEAKRAQLLRMAQGSIAACKAQYPE